MTKKNPRIYAWILDDGQVACLDLPDSPFPMPLLAHTLATARFQGKIAALGDAHVRLMRLEVVEDLHEERA